MTDECMACPDVKAANVISQRFAEDARRLRDELDAVKSELAATKERLAEYEAAQRNREIAAGLLR